jgi:serine-type D-Ala-D-Ala carboxypeptidase/endopeptidase
MAALKLSSLAHCQTATAVSSFAIAVCMLVTTPSRARAQAAPAIAGDYAGVLGPLQVKLHLKVDAAGAITGALDSPNQGSNGIPCADFHLDGQTLTFSVPVVHGSWKGTVSADGKTLAGTWNQGNPTPLVFTRDAFVPAAKPSHADGIWLGTLQTGGASLRIQLHLKGDAAGKEYCSLDSLDQGSMGIGCSKVSYRTTSSVLQSQWIHERAP